MSCEIRRIGDVFEINLKVIWNIENTTSGWVLRLKHKI